MLCTATHAQPEKNVIVDVWSGHLLFKSVSKQKKWTWAEILHP